MTYESIKIHGKTKKVLNTLGAKAFTKGASQILINFLNEHPDLPIVAHNAEYDRDTVLKGAFDRVDNANSLPPADRWRCTLKMSEDLPDLSSRSLDDLLKYF